MDREMKLTPNEVRKLEMAIDNAIMTLNNQRSLLSVQQRESIAASEATYFIRITRTADDQKAGKGHNEPVTHIDTSHPDDKAREEDEDQKPVTHIDTSHPDDHAAQHGDSIPVTVISTKEGAKPVPVEPLKVPPKHGTTKKKINEDAP